MTTLPQLFGAAYSRRHLSTKPARGWVAFEQLEPRVMLSAATSFSFDFGTATSPVAAGYTQVTDATKFSAALGYGWQSGTIGSRDRGTSDPLMRDFDYTTNGTFAANLPNGSYSVTISTGDTGGTASGFARDDEGFYLEGNLVDTINTANNQIVTRTYSVNVSDGQLNLQLKDLGGSDPYTVIEALKIAPNSTTPPTNPTSSSTASFDFGTATSPVAAGYTQVTDATKFSAALGYGWQSGTIGSRDRGTSDPLMRDFDYTTNGTFAANLPNGSYSVTISTGDTGGTASGFARDDEGFYLEGNLVDTINTANNQIVTRTYSVNVSDGQLNLQLKDLGGSDPYTVIEALQIVPAVATATTGAPGTTTTPGSGGTTGTTGTTGSTSGTGSTTTGTTTTTPPPSNPPVTLNVLNNGPPAGTLPFGAGPNDTSEYMIGSVEVNVVLFQSNGAVDPSNETWTAPMITNVESQVTQELTWWRNMFYKTQNPAPGEDLNFYTDFTYANNPISTPYEAINHRSTDQGLWINSFLSQVGDNNTGSYLTGVREYDNQQRTKNGTDWSFTIFVVNSANDADGAFADGATAYSYVNGPFTMSTYNNGGWGINRMALVLAHETAIDFGALDEYAGTQSYTTFSGYYDTQNLNAADGNPNPASRVTSIMSDGGSLTNAFNQYTSSPTSLQMIGWKDSNGNGIMDALDVPLILTATGAFNASTMTFSLTGSSTAGTLANRNPYTSDHAITLNTVDQLQYSLDGGAWTSAANYGTATATIGQGVHVSTAGAHTISFRTIDLSLGLTSNVLSASFNTAQNGAVTLTSTAAVSPPPASSGGTGTTTSTGAPAAPGTPPMTTAAFPTNKAAQLVAATWSQANVILKLSTMQDTNSDQHHNANNNLPGRSASGVTIGVTI